MTKNLTERRRQNRTSIRVPVKIRPRQLDGVGSELTAQTRDLSSSGIFLYSDSAFKRGSKLELVLMLPSGIGLGPGGWTLCQASVVRTEPTHEAGSNTKRVGVAATFDRIEFLPELI